MACGAYQISQGLGLLQAAHPERSRQQATGPYDDLDLYCQRDDPENRIKQGQVSLFATCTNCRYFQRNQWRLSPAALGLVLVERLRVLALHGTELANVQADMLRIKLLKVAAAITRNTRRIRLYLASNWPSAEIFALGPERPTLILKPPAVPGSRNDTKTARNPGRGRGSCHHHCRFIAQPMQCSRNAVSRTQSQPDSRQFGHTVGWADIFGLAKLVMLDQSQGRLV